jgi:glycine/D-amino acid oxidase-like deaminating enzyme
MWTSAEQPLITGVIFATATHVIAPKMQSFDVVIIGGGVVGSSAAYFLSAQPDFNGTIAVIEKDPTYAEAATPRSAGGIRLQFSTAENVLMGAFGASFIKSADEHLKVGNEGSGVEFRENGYLFLATGAGLKTLLNNQRLQHELGAATELLNPRECRHGTAQPARIAGQFFLAQHHRSCRRQFRPGQ